jgi:hypothetical protein
MASGALGNPHKFYESSPKGVGKVGRSFRPSCD